MFLNNKLNINFFSPLEQFDSVSFSFFNSIYENINIYSYYIFETEYFQVELLNNEYTLFLGLPYVNKSFLVLFVLAIVYSFIFRKEETFSHIFFGIFFSLFFPTAFDFIITSSSIWNSTLDFDTFFDASKEDFQDSIINLNANAFYFWEAYPQIQLAFFFDENFISFLLAFFLLGGSEQEADEDFILEEEEADFADDVVAPLFLTNLGKDVNGNGELLVKVSSIFSFVLINNIMGMLPYSDTGTSSLMLTLWVALSIFFSLLTLMIRKNGISFFFSLFMPTGCPLPLMFLLVPIEFISYSFRLVSLSVRLFANMMAGHTLLKVIVGFSFSMLLMGDYMLLVNLFPFALLFVLTFLEVGVALIQAYIFTILTCIYLKDIFVSH